MRKVGLSIVLGLLALSVAAPANAQYAVGHRSFGGGTSMGGGFSKMEYEFPDIDADKPFLLLPTLELKFFLTDRLSLDFSVPIVNIAASNAIQDYFFFTAEAFINFHPSAPNSFELFVAPGIGISYAQWEADDDSLPDENGWALHVPVRIGFEINNARRNFSMFVAVRPFFSLVHGGKGENKPGGGAFLEVGFMAYSVGYQANRY